MRKSVTGLAVLGVLALALLPPEHVHVTQTDDGHHSEVTHRHFEPHHQVAAEERVDHEDDQARWLDSPFIGPQPLSHVYRVDQFLHEDLPILEPQQASRRTQPFIHVSVHDPPSASSHGLRAPPSFSV
jgi:hypothetical protein